MRPGSGSKTRRRTAEVTTEHEVEDEETILVVLERVPKVDDKWVVNLAAQISSGGGGAEGDARPFREASAPE